MTQVATFDFTAPGRIHLHVDTVTQGFDPIEAYREWRTFLAATPDAREFDPLLDAEGNEPTGPGAFTPNRLLVRPLARIVPFNTSHVLAFKAQMVSKTEGLSDFQLFDRSTLSPTSTIGYLDDYDKIQIREVSTGGGLTTAQNAQLFAIQTPASVVETDGGITVTLNEWQQFSLAGHAGALSAPNPGTAGTVVINSPVTPGTIRIRVPVDGNGGRTGPSELNP